MSQLLAGMVGNPFRRIVLNPAWLTWTNGTVRKIVSAISEEPAEPLSKQPHEVRPMAPSSADGQEVKVMSAQTYYDLFLDGEASQNRSGGESTAEDACYGHNGSRFALAKKRLDQLKAMEMAEADSAWEIRLTCVNGPLKGQSWSFKSVFRIGRLDSVDLRLLEAKGSASISRLHAIISHDDRHWRLADLGSTNGTRLNGRKLGREPIGPLRKLDIIQFGEIAVKVESIRIPSESSAEHPSDAPWAATEGVTLPRLGRIAIGEPVRYKSLTVFPLFGDDNPAVEYLLSDEAIEAGVVTVAEVSQQGSVPELAVTNTGNIRVLLLEGEELRGAKQNRIPHRRSPPISGSRVSGATSTLAAAPCASDHRPTSGRCTRSL
jgi:pSer/pThr/pTyr-binding forkhead associated (FHA) protein